MNLHMKKPIKDYLALALDNYTEKSKISDLIEKTRDYIGVFKVFQENIRKTYTYKACQGVLYNQSGSL